jgi:hypothetical protein
LREIPARTSAGVLAKALAIDTYIAGDSRCHPRDAEPDTRGRRSRDRRGLSVGLRACRPA